MIDKRQSGENPSCTFILVEPNFESLISGVRRPTTVEVEDRVGDAHSCCMKREASTTKVSEVVDCSFGRACKSGPTILLLRGVDAVGCRIIGRDSTE